MSSKEQVASPSRSDDFDDELTARITHNLQNSIAAEVTLAVAPGNRQFTELAAEAYSNTLDELADSAQGNRWGDVGHLETGLSKQRNVSRKVRLNFLNAFRRCMYFLIDFGFTI